MHMRPFQIIALVIFAVLAGGGLYLFATFKGVSGSKSLGEVTIWGTLPAGAMQTTLDDLKRSQQQYAKVIYQERSPVTFDRDFSDALASGSGPDLVVISQEQLLTNQNKLQLIPFSSIPERTYRDSYVSICELFLTKDGAYGIPFVVDPLVLYYNRARLSTVGYAGPPSTWEEVLGQTSSLTQKNAGVITKSAIALGTYENIPNARAILSLLLLQSGTAITQNSPSGLTSVLRKGETVSGVAPAESAINFYTQFADPAKVVYTWNRALPSALTDFMSGDSALYIGYASEYPFMKGANPNLDFDITAIPSPQTASGRVDYARAYVFSIPRNAKNPSASYQVASALAASSQVPVFAKAASMAPALRSLVNSRTDDPNATVYYPLALIAKGWLSPASAVTDQIFADMINTVISGRGTVTQAVKNADDALVSALGR